MMFKIFLIVGISCIVQGIDSKLLSASAYGVGRRDVNKRLSDDGNPYDFMIHKLQRRRESQNDMRGFSRMRRELSSNEKPWGGFNFPYASVNGKREGELPAWGSIRLPYWFKRSEYEDAEEEDEIPMRFMMSAKKGDMLSRKKETTDLCKKAIEVCSNAKRSAEEEFLKTLSEKLRMKE